MDTEQGANLGGTCKLCLRFRRRYQELNREALQELSAYTASKNDKDLSLHRAAHRQSEELVERWVNHIKKDHVG
jgi:hypothetical protein